MGTTIEKLTLALGEDFATTWTFKDDGVPEDISARTYRAEVKASYSLTAPTLAAFSFALVTDGTDGAVEMTMPKATVLGLAGLTGLVWDMFETVGGLDEKIMRGDVEVESSATATAPVTG